MEDNELLDSSNEINIAAFHYIFIPLINNKLNAWRHSWSEHRIRTIKTLKLQKLKLQYVSR